MNDSRRRIADGGYDFRPTRELLMPDMDGVAYGQTTAAIRREQAALTRFSAPPETQRTPAKRRRFRRNEMIYWGKVRLGLSHQFLADAFDLPKSRIYEILMEMESLRCSASNDATASGSK